MKDTKFVALFDLHVGREYRFDGTKIVWNQTHDDNLIKLACDFIEDFKPDVLIYGGDQSHALSTTHHSAGKTLTMYENAYTEDLKILKKVVDKIDTAAVIKYQLATL